MKSRGKVTRGKQGTQDTGVRPNMASMGARGSISQAAG